MYTYTDCFVNFLLPCFYVWSSLSVCEAILDFYGLSFLVVFKEYPVIILISHLVLSRCCILYNYSFLRNHLNAQENCPFISLRMTKEGTAYNMVFS